MAAHSYKVYLLRLWQEGANGRWRGTLTNPLNNEKYHFATLEDLIEELEAFDGSHDKLTHESDTAYS